VRVVDGEKCNIFSNVPVPSYRRVCNSLNAKVSKSSAYRETCIRRRQAPQVLAGNRAVPFGSRGRARFLANFDFRFSVVSATTRRLQREPTSVHAPYFERDRDASSYARLVPQNVARPHLKWGRRERQRLLFMFTNDKSPVCIFGAADGGDADWPVAVIRGPARFVSFRPVATNDSTESRRQSPRDGDREDESRENGIQPVQCINR
jgi:hypothetical protein